MKQSIDWWLVGCYFLLLIIGWANIFSASHSMEPILNFDSHAGKQLVWIASAIVLGAIIIFFVPPRLWEAISFPAFLGVGVLLLAVIFLGAEVKGSHSWFRLGPVQFQPAELSKISTALLLSMLMSRPYFSMADRKHFASALAVLGLPILIILAENETGSALVYLGFLFVLYREGMSGWILAVMGLCIALFISTLTLSSYHSVMILIGSISLIYAIGSDRFTRWLYTDGIFIGVLSLLPWAWRMVCAALIPGAQLYFNNADPSVAGAIAVSTGYASLLDVDLIWIAIAVSVAGLVVNIVKALRDKELRRWVAVGALFIGLVLIFSTDYIFNNVLKPHQRVRIEVLLGMKEDPTGVGYNVNQSMIAIGSGGLAGKGYLNGTQTSLGFVPEQSTDFIFCTVGEEWGFAGSIIVIILYVFLIMRILHDAEKSREAFTRIYGWCVASCIFMHLCINIGMTIGIMPVIGIPLPLLSYGGSSLWAFTILLSIFIALDREEKKYF